MQKYQPYVVEGRARRQEGSSNIILEDAVGRRSPAPNLKIYDFKSANRPRFGVGNEMLW